MNSSFSFTVNGNSVTIEVAPTRRLGHVLREDLGLTGTKIGCDAGDCGACTILLDGRQVCSCMVSAAQADGRDIQTIEGLADNGTLNDLQQAFHLYGAAQCGICTPGMLMAATDLLSQHPAPSEQQVQDSLGGVLCRCTGYRKIIDAVLHVADPAGAGIEIPEAGKAVGARAEKRDGRQSCSPPPTFPAITAMASIRM